VYRGFGQSHGPVSQENLSARDLSPALKSDVDKEVRHILDTSMARVRDTLKRNEKALHRVAQKLLKHEVLDAAQIKAAVTDEAEGAVAVAPAATAV
jgi:ATP-dependent Zn protease